MKSNKLMAIFPMLCVIVMGALLTACGGSTSDSSSTDAQKQFLADRGAGTPTAGTSATGTDSGGPSAQGTPGAQGGPGGRAFPGVFGNVDRVEGDKIYVKDQSGQATTVQLAAGGKIFKQTTAQASDIKMGDAILATGTKNGTAIVANSVQIADGSMLADMSAAGAALVASVEGVASAARAEVAASRARPVRSELPAPDGLRERATARAQATSVHRC